MLDELVDGHLGETEALVRGEVLVGVLYVKSTALSDHIEVLASMQNFLLVFGQKNWHHFFPIGEPLLPILVIEVRLDVLFLASFVFTHNELFKGVLEHSAEDPLLEDLEVRKRGLFEEKREKVTYGCIATAYHEFVDDVEEGATLFIPRINRQPLQVVHDSDAVLEVEPDFLQG